MGAEKTKETEVKSYGEQLAEHFGISQFKHAVIQKIIGITANIYIITIDSRMDKSPIPVKKLKKQTTSGVSRVAKRKPLIFSFTPFVMQDTLFMKDVTLSLPVKLHDFATGLETNSIVFFRDLLGEYHFSKSKYDSH